MKFQFSAGGIVYKKENGGTFVLVSQHSMHHGWVFPKGLIGDHKKEEKKSASAKSLGPLRQSSSEASETKEKAALREVKEETGVDARIVRPLTPVEYWFKFEGETIKKKVYYFLMEYLSGDITKHDKEMENVEWLPIEKVEERLTYKSDKIVWKVALRAINRRLKAKNELFLPN